MEFKKERNRVERGYYEINRMTRNYPVKIVPHEHLIESTHLDNGHILKHWHRSIEIFWVANSSCMIWKNGQTKKMVANDMEIMNSGEAHEYYGFAQDTTYGCSILISYKFLKELFADIDNYHFILDRNHPSYNKLMDAVSRMKDIYLQNEELYNLQIRSVLYEILYLLMKDFKYDKHEVFDVQTQKYAERYKEILSYMNEHYKENITLNEVAEHFGYTSEYFSRSFKKYIGINYKDHIKSLRVNAAKKLLLESDKTITDIAFEIGAPDSKAFIRDFKNAYGVTPLKFRKVHRDMSKID